MALGGYRFYDEDGNPISSTEQSGNKRALDVSIYEGSVKGDYQLRMLELNELILNQLKMLNAHLEMITECEIKQEDLGHED